jgi:hypothetical protein
MNTDDAEGREEKNPAQASLERGTRPKVIRSVKGLSGPPVHGRCGPPVHGICGPPACTLFSLITCLRKPHRAGYALENRPIRAVAVSNAEAQGFALGLRQVSTRAHAPAIGTTTTTTLPWERGANFASAIACAVGFCCLIGRYRSLQSCRSSESGHHRPRLL